jgi:hypothetical protein
MIITVATTEIAITSDASKKLRILNNLLWMTSTTT